MNKTTIFPIYFHSFFVLFWNLPSGFLWVVCWGDVLTKIAAAKKDTLSWVKWHAQREFVCIKKTLHPGVVATARAAVKIELYYWNDTLVFFFAVNKNNAMQSLWPLLLFKSRFLSLIWQTTSYFLQNDTVVIPPGDWRQWVNGRKRTTHFGVKLTAQNVSYFF